MTIMELSVLWMLCLFSVVIITKSTQIVVGHEQLYCLGMERRHRLKRIHSRNEFVPVLVPFGHYTKSCNTGDSKGVLLHWHYDDNTTFIINTNETNWKICTEFGKQRSKDGDLYFLRIININLEKKKPNEEVETHRNCRNWEAHRIEIDGAKMDEFVFIYQVQRLRRGVRFIANDVIQIDEDKDEKLSDIMLLPTEFTTDWIPGPRPGIVMMPMRRCINNKGLNWCVSKEDLDEIAKKHKIFKKRAFKLAAFKSAMIGAGIVGAVGFFPLGVSIVIGGGAGAMAMNEAINNADARQEMLNKRNEQGLSLNHKEEDVKEYLQDEIRRAQQILKQRRN